MTNPINTNHPYWHIRSILKNHREEIKKLNFSYYNYVPQTVYDDRKSFKVAIDDFLNLNFVREVINKTPIGFELAFHSIIEFSNRENMHIPMIDMSTGSAAQINKLQPFIGDEVFSGFKWYKSGRSYHGYSSTLITPVEWRELMGKLLLANQIGLPPTVDTRWVGHRLIAGYSALRWTKNTQQYIAQPKEIS